MACCQGQRCFTAYEDVTYRYRIPRTDKQSVKPLVRPELPHIVKAKRCLGDTDAAPGGQHQDEEGVLQVSFLDRVGL